MFHLTLSICVINITSDVRVSKAIEMDKIRGLRIKLNVQLLHQLFADDIDIFLESTKENFQKVTSLISLYKRILEAKLNLHKSVLIKLNNSPPPKL